MIHKILVVKNIGRFENCSWRGGSQFDSMTLLYGENGRGKSTICDVLRSFQTGIADYITGRKRLGATGDCEATLLSEGNKKATYKVGKWDSTQPALAIFDTTFVHENVYAGDRVDHEHKKNLYRVIVGEQGVKLAATVDRLDGEIRDAGKDAKGKLDILTAKLPTGTDLKTFAKLAADADIATKIAAKEGEIKAAEGAQKKAADIKAKGLLQEVAVPALPTDFEALLAEKLPTLAESAEKQLRAHLAGHTNGASETWISQGLAFQKEESCPFCGQGTQGLPLITAYRAFFDNAYDALKKKLTACAQAVAVRLNERSTLATLKVVGDNAALWEFWHQLGVGADLSLPDISALGGILGDLRDAANDLLTLKNAAPLDAVTISEDFTKAQAALAQIQATASSYNSTVRTFNAEVNRFKMQQAATDVVKLKSELAALKLVELRHSADILAAIEIYKSADGKKKQLEKDKATAKTELDQYSTAVLAAHEKRINELLKMFAAGFRIGGTEGSYVGGKVSSNYKLLINKVSIELGDDRTPASAPSFRNTLSAGDRSTLALALFVSQLERDPDLKDKIVVFDDPFTSQDRSRRTATQTLICGLAKKAKQVLVLSHDPYFLRAIWDGYKGGGIKCFQFARMGDGTSIGEWEIEKETAGEYAKKHRVLWNHCYDSAAATASAREVAQTIRPVLEEYLRLKLPHAFAEKEWLGDFISKIRDATTTDPLVAAQGILKEIEDINEYSKRYHHSSNPAADTEFVDETELLSFVQRTLDLVGGF